MRLYVVRHAIAEERSVARPDAERRLTKEGARRFTQHVRALERLGVRFSHVFHSPWRRAAETAALLAPLSSTPPSPLDALAAPPDEALLEPLAGSHVALVGHEPWLGSLIAWLVIGSREEGARFVVKKGAVAQLEGEPRPGAMRLSALLSPKLLRLAGRS